MKNFLAMWIVSIVMAAGVGLIVAVIDYGTADRYADLRMPDGILLKDVREDITESELSDMHELQVLEAAHLEAGAIEDVVWEDVPTDEQTAEAIAARYLHRGKRSQLPEDYTPPEKYGGTFDQLPAEREYRDLLLWGSPYEQEWIFAAYPGFAAGQMAWIFPIVAAIVWAFRRVFWAGKK